MIGEDQKTCSCTRMTTTASGERETAPPVRPSAFACLPAPAVPLPFLVIGCSMLALPVIRCTTLLISSRALGSQRPFRVFRAPLVDAVRERRPLSLLLTHSLYPVSVADVRLIVFARSSCSEIPVVPVIVCVCVCVTLAVPLQPCFNSELQSAPDSHSLCAADRFFSHINRALSTFKKNQVS